MTTIPPTAPPLAKPNVWKKDLPVSTAFVWLSAGWRDFKHSPGFSIFYGIGVWLVSVLLLVGMFLFNYDYILLPVLSGFLIVGPVIAVGLYQKSSDIAENKRVSLMRMLFVRVKSGGQIVFAGVLLLLLMLLWMRAAVILYALFFGLRPFPGFGDIPATLLHDPYGIALIIVGSAVGGVFAAFSYAISVFSLPALLSRTTDALTAMGMSMAIVWNNLSLMIAWGAIVLALVTLSIVTGLIGMIVVFPILGHATWHAYQTMCSEH
ncbi:DUF2189 domain-containing protein [Thalassospira xiamenensis]|uniref:Uncharacterized membrane protein n=1 Tax=Thalassospira xiamenensis TaxID=220697 RepID=A0A285U1X2_9PROT|nr:DUF2189 domain-containing protein [Thalassospira xiamenensis]SOC30176.1 Uncharacterized membrane protein [Thalassospira xiamenensis]